MHRLIAAGTAIVIAAAASSLAAPAIGLAAGTAPAAVGAAPGSSVTGGVSRVQRKKAVAAARRAVPGSGERVDRVHREQEHRRGMYCVELVQGDYEYDVDLDRDFQVIEVEREYND